MEELVECIVNSRLTMKAYFGRCLSVALGILMVIVTYVAALKVPYGIPVVLLFDLAAGFVIYFVFRNTNVEFEYDYFGGELTVDKILNRAKRKRLRIFDFAKLDYIAKYGSERMTRLEEHGNSAYYNYSAHDIRILFLYLDRLSTAKVFKCGILEFKSEFFGNNRTTCKNCNIFKHFFSSVTISGCFNSYNIECSS